MTSSADKNRGLVAFVNEAQTHIDLLELSIDALPGERRLVMGEVMALTRLATKADSEAALAVLAEMDMEVDQEDPDKSVLRRAVMRLKEVIALLSESGDGAATATEPASPPIDPELWACFVEELRVRLRNLRTLADQLAKGEMPTDDLMRELVSIRDAAATVDAGPVVQIVALAIDAIPRTSPSCAPDFAKFLHRAVLGLEGVCDAPSNRFAAVHADLEDLDRLVREIAAFSSPQADAPHHGPSSEATRPPSMLDDTALLAELRGVFIDESREQLEELNQLLLTLERTPSPEAVQKIFRLTHTLKGSAGTVGLHDVARTAHGLEEIFARVRDGRETVESLKFDDLLGRVDSLAVGIGLPKERGHSALERGELPGVEASPSPDERTDTEDRSVRVSLDRLDVIGNASAELAIGQTRLEELIATLKDATKTIAQHRASLIAAIAELERDGATRRLVSLEYDIADTLSGLDRLSRTLSGEARLQRRTLVLLQDQAMRTRWVSLRGTFRRLRRPVRDLAHEIGKRVRLDCVGEETEIDRVLAESMIEPLIQMARNSVAHGLEFPADRLRAGKGEEGNVTVLARHQGGSVVIEVVDDGVGLDPARIREIAVGKQLIERAIADATPDEKIIEAIFLPGFTTRVSADLVAGRGVGLDVVATAVARMGGTIQITSRRGHGTRFTIKLPLTLAVLQTLNFRVGRQTFAISLASVDGTIRVAEHDFETAGHQEGLRHRGQWLPVVRLRRLWGLRDETSPHWPAIVVDIVQRRYAILVDELIGRGEVVVKSLGAFLAPFRLYLGAAIVGRGGIRPIVDPGALWDLASQPTTRRAPRPEAVESRGVILVVDDSLIIRKVVAQLLEHNGYRVILATDGREAWSLLKSHHVDLIISDLEMPRMHGYELLERLKDSPIHAATPVLVLSSRATKGNRTRVLEMGAADFLPKPVNERTVLECVRAVLHQN